MSYEFLVYMDNSREERRVNFAGNTEAEARTACEEWLSDRYTDGPPNGHIVACTGCLSIQS